VNNLPEIADHTLLVRTDFSDHGAWQALHTALTSPGLRADMHIVDDPTYRDLSPRQLISLAPAAGFPNELLIVADKAAVTSSEMPLLVIYQPAEEDRAELRVIAEELWAIEANIAFANMEWEEFVDAADDDGVFRGF
jgi:hypothetical protein